MERLVLIGVSHRRGGAAALEAWQQTFGADAALDELGFGEWAALATCNRWDLVAALPEGLGVEEARRRLTPLRQATRPYAYVGEGALEQLARVAASLDSLNPGEDQIMAQVREAFASAQAAGRVGPTLAFAFPSALRIAKRVRREVALAPVHASLFSLARADLEAALGRGGSVAVLGAGQMGTLAAKSLAALPGVRLLLVNRSVERARQLARQLGAHCQPEAEAMALPDFLAAPPPLDVLVCATPVKDLIDEGVLQRLGGLRLAVDLGIPRNIRVEAAERRGLRVLDVDSLQIAGQARREELAGRLAEAERIVQTELEGVMAEWTERQLGPVIKRLRDWYLETIGDALPADEAAKLAHKFAHVPVKGLRALAREHGLEAARTFVAETGLGE